MTNDDEHMRLLKEIGLVRLEFVGLEERVYKLIDDFYTHMHPEAEKP